MKFTPSEDFDLIPPGGLEDEETKPSDEVFPIATQTLSDEEEDYGEFSSSAPEPSPPIENPDNLIFKRFKLKKEISRLNYITGVLERKLEALIATPGNTEAMNDNKDDGYGTDIDFTDEIADYRSVAIESLREEYHNRLEKVFREDETSGEIPWIDTVPPLKKLNESLAEYMMSMSARDLLDLRRWLNRVLDQGMRNCLPCGPTSASRFQWKKKYNENGLNDIFRLILRNHESLEDLEKLRSHYDRILGKGMVLSYSKRRKSGDSKIRESVDSNAEDSDAA